MTPYPGTEIWHTESRRLNADRQIAETGGRYESPLPPHPTTLARDLSAAASDGTLFGSASARG